MGDRVAQHRRSLERDNCLTTTRLCQLLLPSPNRCLPFSSPPCILRHDHLISAPFASLVNRPARQQLSPLHSPLATFRQLSLRAAIEAAAWCAPSSILRPASTLSCE